jgi:hypothetical protein
MLTLTVAKGEAVVMLADLAQTFNGSPKSVSASTNPGGLAVAITYDGSATGPVNAGSYEVVATVVDPNYSGSAAGTLVIAPAVAIVTLGDLAQTYDGTPKPASATTSPDGLAVALTYDGDATAPTAAGSYAVVATLVNPNYIGSATGTLVIAKAVATITLGALQQPYDGTPRTVTATTDPAGLVVVVLYDDVPTPPTLPGSYEVAAAIDDTNYTGEASGTLVVTTTALVRHGVSLNGAIDGSLQILSGEDTALKGGSWISGDLLVPGTPSLVLNGNPLFAGVLNAGGDVDPTNYSVTLGGSSILRHLVRRVDPIELPQVNPPPPPSGTQNVTLSKASNQVADWSVVRNLTLGGAAGVRAVPPGTYGNFTANGSSGFILGVAASTEPAVYNLQNLSLGGAGKLEVIGPVVLTLANGVSLNASIGNAGHPEWLTIRIASGGLILSDGLSVRGSVVAPAGTVEIGLNATIYGTIAADRLSIAVTGLLDEPQSPN